ncbi:hypothetical protein Tco_0893475 [Tanacetum coccineum]|uniref:Uncharacterized protein n=1 Tax=Tanacetum coccineum TaxID=301880 RepID=A0ABQ5CBS7_9ASTR
MTTLKFADTHNMVAFLAKPTESEGFEQIVDFLNLTKTVNGEVQLQALVDKKKIVITESSVRKDLQLEYAEGVDCLSNATIFEQLTLMGAKTTAWNEFSSTMTSAIICLNTNQKFNFSKYIFESMVKNLDNASKFLMYPRFVQVFVNQQLKGMLAHKRIYIAPSHYKKIFANMRRSGKDFSSRVTPLFQTMVVQDQGEMGEGSAIPTDPQHTPTIIQPSTSQPQKKQRSRRLKRKDTKVPQPSDPTNIVDEVVNEEMDDSLVRAATTASSLEVEQDSETIWDTIAQTRSKNVSKLFNDPLISRGNILRSGEDRLKLKELMEFCTKLQQRVLDLENIKTAQAHDITSLKLRVKKLEKKGGSRTHKLKRLYKGRIADIDADVGINLVSTHFDADTDMFGVHDLVGDEVVVESEVVVKNVVEENISAAATTVSAASKIPTITTVGELTLAQALAKFKSARPPTQGISFRDPSEATTATTTTTTITAAPKPP